MEDEKSAEDEKKDLYGDFGKFVHESLTMEELGEVFAEIRTGSRDVY